MDPLDLPTSHVVEFILGWIPRGASVLEIGCGQGHLAAALGSLGFRVIAIDSDPECIREARERGADARCEDALAFRGGPFDALLFTRSLHHIHPLAAALDRAHGLLVPGGSLLVDDFDVAAADRATAEWFARTRLAARRDGLVGPSITPEAADPLESWRLEHTCDPPLHTGREMEAAIAERFGIEESLTCPNLYRCFCGRLPCDARGVEAASTIFEMESSLIRSGRLRAMGRRWSARRD